ncbi:hypothetical protein MKL74_14855 [Brucella abortus]|nr:hypothetical protein [Brucella abortus]MCH1756905.1 hypothetical protein [Brucella abortus]MCH1761207.1 hypothetical protein [Brucella abortus]
MARLRRGMGEKCHAVWVEAGSQRQASSYKPDSELSQEERDARWKKFMNYARNNRCWHSDVWGPMPNMLGCRVPAHLILPTDGRKSNGDPWTEQERIAA